ERLELRGLASYAGDQPLLGAATGGILLSFAAGPRLLLPLGFAASAASAWEVSETGALGARPRWIGSASLPADLRLAAALGPETGSDGSGQLIGLTGSGALITAWISPGSRYGAGLGPGL